MTLKQFSQLWTFRRRNVPKPLIAFEPLAAPLSTSQSSITNPVAVSSISTELNDDALTLHFRMMQLACSIRTIPVMLRPSMI